jgi:glucosamine--fructose-6-phosphate aminotransferase (isomerizing)
MSLHAEIFEQPARLQHLLTGQRQAVEAIADAIRSRSIAFAFLAARGTSDNAGRYANYLWGSVNRIPLALATPSLFTYYQTPPALRDALVIGVSQSGHSPDIVSVLAEGRRQGCLTLAITNAAQSPLADQADFVLDIQSGPEKAVAATKTYTGQLLAVAMLSAALAQDETMWREMARIPDWVARVLELDNALAQMAQRYRYMQRCVVLGRGFNYATAFEWSLKLKELTYVIAEPYSSADFQHGPIAMLERGFPVMMISPRGIVFPSLLELMQHLKQVQQAELVVISDDEDALALADSAIPLPQDVPEWLSPLVGIVPAQLFAYHLTRVKGLDTETPRSIHKVTDTR